MRATSLLVLALAAIGLAGCYPDPYQNPYDWSMNGAPRENIAVQAAQPSDLLQGHGEPGADGITAAAPVDAAIGGTAQTGAGLLKPPTASNIFSFSSGS
jgi:hypothetical protein